MSNIGKYSVLDIYFSHDHHPFLSFPPERQGNYRDAEALYQRSITIWEKTFGPDHPDVGMSLRNMANMLYKQVRTKEEHPRNGVISIDVCNTMSTKCPLTAQGEINEASILFKPSSTIRITPVWPSHSITCRQNC